MKKIATAVVTATWFAVLGSAPASPETFLREGYAIACGWLARYRRAQRAP
jgi:hypothetical protein